MPYGTVLKCVVKDLRRRQSEELSSRQVADDQEGHKSRHDSRRHLDRRVAVLVFG